MLVRGPNFGPNFRYIKQHQKCTKPRFYIVAKVSPDSLATMLQNSSLASKTVIVVKEMAILFATLSFLQDFII